MVSKTLQREFFQLLENLIVRGVTLASEGEEVVDWRDARPWPQDQCWRWIP
jgi:hypothetical protein